MAKDFDLTPKQKLFCDEYLKDLNATKAAERVGYKKRSAAQQAARLLTNDKIQKYVQSKLDARTKRAEVTQDMVVNELKKIAFSNMGTVAKWNHSGVSFFDSDDLSEDAKSTVMSVEESTNQHGGSLKIKQYDKTKALELLGRHLGMFKDKIEHSGDLTLEQILLNTQKKAGSNGENNNNN